MSAGYSGTPLPKKLGIKDDSRVVILGAPDGVPIEGEADLGDGADVVLFFTAERAALQARLPELRAAVFPAGGLWICWPKKASKVPTDITEDVVRDLGIAAKMVDNKVCAVDDVWSGLRLVIRIKDRT
ncbi:MAG: hypothetical protein QOF76_399 [Solirubrobacteraceae bacterium]|nr:hypothetical protein [Solirubrobacteraceae bacterium]